MSTLGKSKAVILEEGVLSPTTNIHSRFTATTKAIPLVSEIPYTHLLQNPIVKRSSSKKRSLN